MKTEMKKSDEVLLYLLDENLKKRFEVQTLINELQIRISESAKNILYEKIGFNEIDEDKNKIYTANGIDYKIIGIRAEYSTYMKISYPDNIHIEVYFASVSKTTKEKQLKIDDAKNNYKNNKYIGWCNYKVKLWGYMTYTLKIDNIFRGLQNNFNFEKDLITL